MAAYNFLGKHSHSIDSKKRVAIPAKFRQQLPEGDVYITTLPEGCLVVYPKSEWEGFLEGSLGKLDPLSQADRKTKREIVSKAGAFPLDKQGRINLNSDQMKETGIRKGVLFVGAINCFEIWSREKWEAEEASVGEEEERQ